MFSNIISRSTAAFGGAPCRLNKCTSLGSAGAGAAAGSAVGGVPGALVGGSYRDWETAAAPEPAEPRAVHKIGRAHV